MTKMHNKIPTTLTEIVWIIWLKLTENGKYKVKLIQILMTWYKNNTGVNFYNILCFKNKFVANFILIIFLHFY